MPSGSGRRVRLDGVVLGGETRGREPGSPPLRTLCALLMTWTEGCSWSCSLGSYAPTSLSEGGSLGPRLRIQKRTFLLGTVDRHPKAYPINTFKGSCTLPAQRCPDHFTARQTALSFPEAWSSCMASAQ